MSTLRAHATPCRNAALRMAITLVVLSAPLAAQTAGGGRHRLSLALGWSEMNDRDLSMSPLRYQGGGLEAALGYGREGPGTRAQFLVRFASAGLHPARPGELKANVDDVRLTAQLSYLHAALRLRGGRLRVFGGALLDLDDNARESHYALGETRTYLSAFMSVAPAVQLEFDPGPDRTFTCRLSAPFATGVIRSWSDDHLLSTPEQHALRWSGPATFRAIQQTIAYTARLGAHAGFRAETHLNLFDFSGDPPATGSRMLVSVGLLWWTRRSER